MVTLYLMGAHEGLYIKLKKNAFLQLLFKIRFIWFLTRIYKKKKQYGKVTPSDGVTLPSRGVTLSVIWQQMVSLYT